MAVRVRVKNFQSLEDVDLVIDGFVVVSGPNNSGKSALMRAIRALFTNAAPGPLLRHGAAYLEVEITFDDGTKVLWEKGTEDPEGKGKTVNRYTLNGKTLSSVGRGVPPEIADLGITEVAAGSSKIWPQIAEQFDPLFLLNRSGSVVAEALSDVEKVGKLTEALRLSEKDKRSHASELKIRKQDLSEAKNRLEQYEGLDSAGEDLKSAEEIAKSVSDLAEQLEVAQALNIRWGSASATFDSLKDFDWENPDSSRPEKISKILSKIKGYQETWAKVRKTSEKFEGFCWERPEAAEASSKAFSLKTARALYERLKALQTACKAFEDLSLDVPPAPAISSKKETLSQLRELRRRLLSVNTDLTAASADAKHNEKLLAEAEAEVTRLLGDRGFCPTCKTVTDALWQTEKKP